MNSKINFKRTEKSILLIDINRWAAPPGAVSCGHDCFLGQSFYSDGLCHEFIGTISMKEQLIEAVQNNQVDQCPFFTFLTSNE